MASSRQSSVAAARTVAPPGSTTPVMSILAAAQQDIMALSGIDLKDELKRFDKVPNVSNMGMFTMHPDEFGAGMRVLEDVTTLVEYCPAYRMGHLSKEEKFQLFIFSAFSKEFRKSIPRGTGQHYQHRAGQQDLRGLPQLIRSL